MLAYTLVFTLYSIYLLFSCDYAYASFEISDWLINYQGGFVRRGLAGEGLFLLYKYFGLNIALVIKCTILIGMLLFFALMVNLFKKRGLSLFLLPLCFCCGAMLTQNPLWFRRDAWMLLLAAGIFQGYHKLLYSGQKASGTILFYALSALLLLLHEGAAFFVFPFIALHFCGHQCRQNGQFFKAGLRTILLLAPQLALFAMVCLHKGNAQTAHAIWNSWLPLFKEFSIGNEATVPSMGAGVEWLTFTTGQTARLHFTANWLASLPHLHIPVVIIWVVTFSALFYLCVNVNKIKWSLYPVSDQPDAALLPALLIVQAGGQLLMFTILSCDFMRLAMYSVCSAFMIYGIFKDAEIKEIIFGDYIARFSTWFLKQQGRISWINGEACYCAVYLLFGMSAFGCSLGLVKNSIAGHVVWSLYALIRPALHSLAK